VRSPAGQSRVIAYLTQHGPTQTRQLAQGVGLTMDDIYTELSRLRRAGLIRGQETTPVGRRAAPKVWALAQFGEEAA
jgi:predicted transcriptional regulator